MRKIVLKKEYQERKNANTVKKVAGVAKKTLDSTLRVIEDTSKGKAGRAARLLRELMNIFSEKK